MLVNTIASYPRYARKLRPPTLVGINSFGTPSVSQRVFLTQSRVENVNEFGAQPAVAVSRRFLRASTVVNTTIFGDNSPRISDRILLAPNTIPSPNIFGAHKFRKKLSHTQFAEANSFGAPAIGDVVPLSLDGHAASSGSVSGSGNIAATLTTANSNDIIVACIYNEAQGHSAGPHAVSGVSGGGLTWTQRSSQTSTAFNGSALEVWWAHASSPLSSVTITASFAGTTDDASIIVFGVSGCSNVAAPFDTNASLPKTAQSTSASSPSVAGVSTDFAKTFIFGAAGSQTFFSSPGDLVAPLTTPIANTNTGAGSGFSSAIAAEEIVSAPQSSQGFGINRNCGSWIFIVDAIRG
jgi:hypothetical protein